MAMPPGGHYHHPEEDDYDGEELTPGTTDGSSLRYGKSAKRRTNNSRSKHSETEQRRRSKINERFQILKDLIPPNDQKRDKASLLLEVIEYIQFLQEKIHLYEGSCQSWSQEPTKLIPWRSNDGHDEEGYSDHPQVMKYGFGHDNNGIQPIANMQSTFESDFGDDPAYRVAYHVTQPIPDLPPNMSLLPTTVYSSGASILPAENLASQSELQVWHGGSSAAECNNITGNRMNEQDTAPESISSDTSNAYSQRLLKSLTKALQTAGVNLSQANISVQLDVGKHQNSNHTLMSSAQGHPGNGSSTAQRLMHCREGKAQDSNQAAKRFRTEESYLNTEKQIQLR